LQKLKDMNKERQIELFNQAVDTCEYIMLNKTHDYANNDNIFKAFDQIALMTETSRDKVLLQFISTKLTRLVNLLNSDKEPKNETIKDNLLDMINYCLFLYISTYDNNTRI